MEDRDRVMFEDISTTLSMHRIDYLCKDWLHLTTTFLLSDRKRSNYRTMLYERMRKKIVGNSYIFLISITSDYQAP